MFCTLLATIHFHFVFALAFLLNVGPICLVISSSHCCGGLLISLFRSLGYHSTTAYVHLLSKNLVICPVQWKLCFRYSAIYILCSSLLLYYLALVVLMDLSIDLCAMTNLCSSFFVGAHISLVFNPTAKMVAVEEIGKLVLSSFALSTSYIVHLIFINWILDYSCLF